MFFTYLDNCRVSPFCLGIWILEFCILYVFLGLTPNSFLIAHFESLLIDNNCRQYFTPNQKHMGLSSCLHYWHREGFPQQLTTPSISVVLINLLFNMFSVHWVMSGFTQKCFNVAVTLRHRYMRLPTYVICWHPVWVLYLASSTPNGHFFPQGCLSHSALQHRE